MFIFVAFAAPTQTPSATQTPPGAFAAALNPSNIVVQRSTGSRYVRCCLTEMTSRYLVWNQQGIQESTFPRLL